MVRAVTVLAVVELRVTALPAMMVPSAVLSVRAPATSTVPALSKFPVTTMSELTSKVPALFLNAESAEPSPPTEVLPEASIAPPESVPVIFDVSPMKRVALFVTSPATVRVVKTFVSLLSVPPRVRSPATSSVPPAPPTA